MVVRISLLEMFPTHSEYCGNQSKITLMLYVRVLLILLCPAQQSHLSILCLDFSICLIHRSYLTPVFQK